MGFASHPLYATLLTGWSRERRGNLDLSGGFGPHRPRLWFGLTDALTLCLAALRHVLANFPLGAGQDFPTVAQPLDQPAVVRGQQSKAEIADLKFDEELFDLLKEVNAHTCTFARFRVQCQYTLLSAHAKAAIMV